MLTKEFDYKLPKELIADKPVFPRDTSKLMVLNRTLKTIDHRKFYELPDILNENYVLVLNNSKVIAAKLYTDKGEILLIKKINSKEWKAMVKPGKRFKLNTVFKIKGKIDTIQARVNKIMEDGTRIIEFLNIKSTDNWIENNGYPPFPPYIKNSKASFKDYQTIYSKDSGSIAAPTAGLHFTKEVLERLKSQNIQKVFTTLHVGRGTFLPVKSENIQNHKMHAEWYSVSEKTAEFLNNAKSENKKILAVGTTAVRTLESNIKKGKFHEECKETDIFIYPGYKFKAVDALLTNFHLPKSTLIMLISAFADKDFILKAYKEAVNKNYRFYSFGDSMLII